VGHNVAFTRPQPPAGCFRFHTRLHHGFNLCYYVNDRQNVLTHCATHHFVSWLHQSTALQMHQTSSLTCCIHRTVILLCTYISTVIRPMSGRSGFDSWQGQEFFSLRHHVQTGCGAHLTSYSIGTAVFSPGHEANHSPPSSAEVKKAWSYTSTSSYVFMEW